MTLKAAECGPMLDWCLQLLQKHGGVASFGEEFIQAGLSLRAFVKGIGANTFLPTPEQMGHLRAQLQMHLKCCRKSGINLVPKHHLTIHMLERTPG